MAALLPSLLVALLLIGGAFAHSWIACTDYLQENGDYWSAANCRGYARNGHRFTPKNNFGIDTGYDNNNVPDSKACHSPRNDNTAYTSEYPMATYYSGQKVVIAHPVKNHVAETCTNKYIPDHGNWVYRSEVNPSADPTVTQFKQNLVVDLGVAPFGHSRTQAEITSYPKLGFQNAPKFCENTDKALATNAFYIPNLRAGRYTFMWSWSFNSKGSGDTYTSCWEADVVASKAERDRVLSGKSLPTRDPELLHGKSLAVAGPGTPVQPQPQPQTTQRATRRPGRRTRTQPANTTPRPGPVNTTPRPGPNGPTGTVSSSLMCVDSCLRQCYTAP